MTTSSSLPRTSTGRVPGWPRRSAAGRARPSGTRGASGRNWPGQPWQRRRAPDGTDTAGERCPRRDRLPPRPLPPFVHLFGAGGCLTYIGTEGRGFATALYLLETILANKDTSQFVTLTPGAMDPGIIEFDAMGEFARENRSSSSERLTVDIARDLRYDGTYQVPFKRPVEKYTERNWQRYLTALHIWRGAR